MAGAVAVLLGAEGHAVLAHRVVGVVDPLEGRGQPPQRRFGLGHRAGDLGAVGLVGLLVLGAALLDLRAAPPPVQQRQPQARRDRPGAVVHLVAQRR